MKSYPSNTTNGGTTIILDTVADAVNTGRKFIDDTVEKYRARGDDKIQVSKTKRDKSSGKGKQMNCSTFADKWDQQNRQLYEQCCAAIIGGDEELKSAIAETLEKLRDAAVEIEPMLACSYSGYKRSIEGFTAEASLVASGDENPCFDRKRAGNTAVQRAGDGAYRIVINTDVAWWGVPADNAAVMGALVTILQQFGPVEVWIQQGWLTNTDPNAQFPGDGVTLFKLDFTGSFEATQLSFWLSHELKDSVFSHCVNKGLGRQHTYTSTSAEIPCDLYMRGDWMTMAELTAKSLERMDCIQRHDAMARWISATAMQIVQPQPQITIEA